MSAIDRGLLDPLGGGDADAGELGDDAFVAAMIDVEVAWLGVLTDAGLAVPGAEARAREALSAGPGEAALKSIGIEAVLGGNAVIPLVAALRSKLAEVDPELADVVHRGLTSQDVLDSALQLIAARLVERRLVPALRRAGDAAAALIEAHGDALCLAHTLAQPALPTTFGARVAAWLTGIQEALDAVEAARAGLTVQLGGAAGTSASIVVALGDGGAGRVGELRTALAERLGLADPGRPWHTTRGPVLRTAFALAGVVAAAGTIAADVATLSRAELGELAEGGADGEGGSSAMPHKRNPVRSVLLRAAAMRAPGELATIAAAAGTFVDERPDGAWHAEWPALHALERLALGASTQLAALLDGLCVDPERMRANLDAAGDAILSERLVTEFAPLLGRARLRSALRDAALTGGSARVAVTSLLDTDGVVDAGSRLDTALDPAGYLGEAHELAARAVSAWRARAVT